MNRYRIVHQRTHRPIGILGGGFKVGSTDEIELWWGGEMPTKEEWVLANLESTALMETPEQAGSQDIIDERIVLQKKRLLKIGGKTIELWWKDLGTIEEV